MNENVERMLALGACLIDAKIGGKQEAYLKHTEQFFNTCKIFADFSKFQRTVDEISATDGVDFNRVSRDKGYARQVFKRVYLDKYVSAVQNEQLPKQLSRGLQ